MVLWHRKQFGKEKTKIDSALETLSQLNMVLFSLWRDRKESFTEEEIPTLLSAIILCHELWAQLYALKK